MSRGAGAGDPSAPARAQPVGHPHPYKETDPVFRKRDQLQRNNPLQWSQPLLLMEDAIALIVVVVSCDGFFR